MSGLTPIETIYAGCRFRSRTEARWAVFFDALGWQWAFEPEGFELPHGRYLPDFRVSRPKDHFWFEVKPFVKSCPNDPRWADLAQLTQTRVLTAYGMHRRGDGCMEAWAHKKINSHCGRLTLPSRGSHWLGPFWTESAKTFAWDKASSARFEFGESG